MATCRVNPRMKRAPLGRLKLHAVTRKDVEEFRDWITFLLAAVDEITARTAALMTGDNVIAFGGRRRSG
jgi:hypothetical protein